MGWPQSYCKFPAWLSRGGGGGWVQLDGQNMYTVDEPGHVIRVGARVNVTSQPAAVLKSLRCLHVVTDRKLSHSATAFVALAFVSNVWCVHITSHTLKVMNSTPCRNVLTHNSLPLITALGYLKLESLKHRRTEADKKLFNGISQPDNCLHHLLPPPRDTQLVTRLRCGTTYKKKTFVY